MLGPLCRVVRDKEEILLEPGNLAPNFTTARQGDFAMTTASPTAQFAAADNTATATPPVAETPEQQEATTEALHTLKAVTKWKGTSRPTGTPSQQTALGTKTVLGHLVIQDMLSHRTVLFPFTINPWL